MTPEIFPVEINISETYGLIRTNKPHRMGIPFPKGAVFSGNELILKDERGHPINFHMKTLSNWPDESIRWLLIDFKITVPAKQTITYTLEPYQDTLSTKSAIHIQETDENLVITNSRISFNISKHEFIQISDLHILNTLHHLEQTKLYLTDDKNQLHAAIIDSISFPKDSYLSRAEITFHGHFNSVEKVNEYFKFDAVLTIYSESPILDLEFTLHNPRAARHKGGFWDLGDPGSLYFRSLIIECKLNQSKNHIWKNLESGKQQEIYGNQFRLYQDSSGGDNWNHHIHIDRNDESTVSFRGYRLSCNGDIVEKDNRATPVFQILTNSESTMSVYVDKFWQNFPKAISCSEDTLKIELFPETPKSPFELQGGEQKTHKIHLNLSGDINTTEQQVRPVNVTLPVTHYKYATAIPGLPVYYKPAILDSIIMQGLDGESDFFKNREKADEFGWRHFGDLWANHETLEHGNDESLVSHYNNQYDPIFGFARQYILTGDFRWFELMNDLVNHVLDIDVYHTEMDKPEYNNGLFWHTDHYLDGRKCTHRTFSINHMLVDHVEQSGGGPGSEHCYTAGLTLHYFLTGNQRSKEITLKLGEWAAIANEGTGTLLERILDFLKTDLHKIRNILKGKYTFNYPLPLSRGTGNYVNALIDLYLLTDEKYHLSRAANIIKNTLGPLDDIEKRELVDDIESNWHYTIMLQSVIRFMRIKESENQMDKDYDYARTTFIHYATWLYQNEKPYLDNREKLIYPNDTWVAQDIRKAYILKSLEEYNNVDERKSISERRIFFTRYVVEHILAKRNFTTRILAIVLQNHFNEESDKTVSNPDNNFIPQVNYDPELKIQNVFYKAFKDILKRTLSINLSKEYQWIVFKLRK